MDWPLMLGGAALLPIVGFLAGVIVTRRWGGSQAEQPRIRRNRLVWQIFQWLLLALGVTVIALITAAWIFIGLEEGTSEFIQGIVLTALAGAISSILSFVGLIVKGLLDELRDGGNDASGTAN